jgi:head-tail adaptor
MNTGQLKIPFTLQSERLVPDGTGGMIAQWTTVGTLWGCLEAVQEPNGAFGNGEARATHYVTARARGDIAITNAHRLVDKDRHYQIRAVVENSKRRWIRLYVTQTTYLN